MKIFLLVFWGLFCVMLLVRPIEKLVAPDYVARMDKEAALDAKAYPFNRETHITKPVSAPVAPTTIEQPNTGLSLQTARDREIRVAYMKVLNRVLEMYPLRDSDPIEAPEHLTQRQFDALNAQSDREQRINDQRETVRLRMMKPLEKRFNMSTAELDAISLRVGRADLEKTNPEEAKQLRKALAWAHGIPDPSGQMGVIADSVIVKHVDSKYRYFFDVRNHASTPFGGQVKITLMGMSGNRSAR